MIVSKIINVIKQVKIKELGVRIESCHLCQWRLQIKIHNDEMGVRCTRCFATPVSQSLGLAFKKHFNTSTKTIYELSSRGSFVRFLKKLNVKLVLSEYFDAVENGVIHKGTLCQNVEKLTFIDNSFDICTCLEVFEHVENDIQGFREVYRVLNKKGVLLFTVPIDLNSVTIERTKVVHGQRKNTLEPEYHSDNIRGTSKVFCYRNYGYDIVERLKQVGFKECEIYTPPKSSLFGFGRPIIIAKKS